MKNTIKLRKDVGYKKPKKTRYIDSARNADSMDVLYEAKAAWDALDGFRIKSRRYRDYYFGRQWGDLIPNPEKEDRKYITEEENIIRQGKTPLKNNMLRQLGKAIIGQFAGRISEPIVVTSDRDEQTLGEMVTVVLGQNYVANKLKELDKRTLERLIISGVICGKVTHGYNHEKQRKDTWVESINPNYLFWDAAASDPRLWDLNLIGEIHESRIEDVVSAFATDKATEEVIRDIYANPGDYTHPTLENLTSEKVDNSDFLCPADPNLCRVIEVWRRESKERYLCHDWASGKLYKIEANEHAEIEKENKKRIAIAKENGLDEDDVALIDCERFIDRYWYARWLTPYGDVLREFESPYAHGSHPYTLTIYPNYDGEVHSFVEDILDQQRYINRLITMYDFIMGASAKGVLMIPDYMLEDKTVEEFADEWVRFNGVITYKAKPGYPMPQQISSNSTSIGAMEMLQMQLQLMTEISGISGALQGKQAKSGTASSLYAQESQNSANNLIDILTAFNTFREDRDTKMMQVDLQYYDQARYINIAGKDYSKEAKYFDPEKVRNVEFDLRISESNDTPAYRQVANDILLQLFQGQQITLRQMLACGAFPFADKLTQMLDRAEEEQAKMAAQGQGAAAMQLPPEMMQEVQAQSNPLMTQMLQKPQ
ncbi:MAG: hypothetical protein UH853_06435 [Muribaculaceae bacterium]|nr:hypothetical protein [Muribaculaceae bacterium]